MVQNGVFANLSNDEILKRVGYKAPNSKDLGQALKSSKPNPYNLTRHTIGFLERLWAVDGMPLIGGCTNSYDNAPAAYRRSLQPYPRQDSPSRQAASVNGAEINAGAELHMFENYAAFMSVLRTISKVRHRQAQEMGEPINPKIALDILNGAISMWSHLLYRKKGRTPKTKLPKEVALMHRTMSGVRISLLRLFTPEDSHTLRDIRDWRVQELNVQLWLERVEAEGLLVSKDDPKQLCPAPTLMIRRVLETIIGGPKPEELLVDIEAVYGLLPEDLIEYGWVWFVLEQAVTNFIKLHEQLLNELTEKLEKAGAELTAATLDEITFSLFKVYRPRIMEHERAIHDSFLRTVELLGYDRSAFRSVARDFGR